MNNKPSERKLITEFGTTFAYVSGPFSLWGRLLYFFSSAQNYISAMPNGYNTDLVLLSQISRTLQKKRHAKLMLQAPRNDRTTSPPQRLPCIKLTLAWLSFSITLLCMTVLGLKQAWFI
jgi:hypothetical protein